MYFSKFLKVLSQKLSLKEIIDNREDSVKVQVYDKKNNVYILIPINYDEFLDYLIETKNLCFYDSKGPVMVVKPGIFSIDNYQQSKLKTIANL